MVDTYGDLSLKTRMIFTEMPRAVDAEFYFKIDDDVGVNVAALAEYLEERRGQGNLYLVRRAGAGVALHPKLWGVRPGPVAAVLVQQGWQGWPAGGGAV